MALESLGSNNINQIILEPNLAPYLDQYKHFKSSIFFDQELKLWKYVDSEQKHGITTWDTGVQLMGVFVQSLFDKQIASKDYHRLKKLGFYDNQKKIWYGSVVDGESGNSTFTFTRIELLDVLILTELNLKAALRSFELIKSKNFNLNTGFWNEAIFDDITPDTFDQLLGSIVSYKLGQSNIGDSLDYLYQSPFYNENMSSFLEHYNLKLKRGGGLLKSNDQLLSVVAEYFRDPYGAKNKYLKLKTSNYYDEKQGYWTNSIGLNGKPYGDSFDTMTQLIGLWCDYLFEKTVTPVSKQQVPLKRSF